MRLKCSRRALYTFYSILFGPGICNALSILFSDSFAW